MVRQALAHAAALAGLILLFEHTSAAAQQGIPGKVSATITVEGPQGPFPGEVDQHSIEILNLRQDLESPHDPATGQPSGRRQAQPLHVTIRVGPYTKPLWHAFDTNQMLTTVRVQFIRRTEGRSIPSSGPLNTGIGGGYTTGSVDVLYTIRLTNANVASMTTLYDPVNGPRNEVAFSFQRIDLEPNASAPSATPPAPPPAPPPVDRPPLVNRSPLLPRRP